MSRLDSEAAIHNRINRVEALAEISAHVRFTLAPPQQGRRRGGAEASLSAEEGICICHVIVLSEVETSSEMPLYHKYCI